MSSARLTRKVGLIVNRPTCGGNKKQGLNSSVGNAPITAMYLKTRRKTIANQAFSKGCKICQKQGSTAAAECCKCAKSVLPNSFQKYCCPGGKMGMKRVF